MKEYTKIIIFPNVKQTLHGTPLQLLDNVSKYEMDPVNIVEDTERTRFWPQTYGQRRADGQDETIIPTFNFANLGDGENVLTEKLRELNNSHPWNAVISYARHFNGNHWSKGLLTNIYSISKFAIYQIKCSAYMCRAKSVEDTLIQWWKWYNRTCLTCLYINAD